MLFNSFQYLLLFLPAALAIYAVISMIAPAWRLQILLTISLAFYSYWDWRFLPLLLGSIALNWTVAQLFTATRRGHLVAIAIAANLILLGVFKYYNFLAGLAPLLNLSRLDIALPLGISFFTFHHIMYLSDLRDGTAPRYDLLRYGLYIAFFPQILSGPLVRWSEVMHQFETNPFQQSDAAERCVRGLVLLILGLCEKTLLGDSLAQIANPIFTASQTGTVSFSDAWLGMLAFSFQIYFDFAGYTDMALGTALMFGIVLPPNFNAPYRATSLQDFWRRWHMTLSRFLRDYLYIPLGGSKYGLAVRLWALFATMALGGLWHGAGLNFIAWGILHGIGLGTGVVWRRANIPLPAIVGGLTTFLFVALCWVLFRSTSFDGALGFYRSLAGATPWGRPWELSTSCLLIVAAVIAVGFPGAWDIVHTYRPRLPAAVAMGVLLAIAVLTLNTGENFEFIYFRF